MKYIIFIPILFFLSAIAAHSQEGDNSVSVSAARYIPSRTSIAFQVGNRKIPITVLQYGEANGIVCINVHDNETASVEGAKAVLEITGGTLIKIENYKQRVIRFKLNGISYGFDPNRIYS
ncbi:MAG: hypothetical protein WBO38_10515, partial [Chitinophagaceae bacterium]